ncbi:hypothetical protein Goshw_014707, partial [Gossypium schwendimanii]|nr:hypothetical protein [Gossypium schwendimanii]
IQALFLLCFFLLGSCRHLAIGPVPIASLVIGTMISESVSAGVSGIFGSLKRQKPLHLSITVILIDSGFDIQLKGLRGILHTSKLQFIPVMTSVFDHRDEIMRKPNLVWESAAVPLTASILSSSALNQKAHGISFGLNPPSLNMLYFNAHYLAFAIKTEVLSLTVGVSVVKILLHVTRPNTGNWEYIPSTQMQSLCVNVMEKLHNSKILWNEFSLSNSGRHLSIMEA